MFFALKRNAGFTLMEMLTVIAIIGVLAALIFPVASSARRRARESQCINNMYQIFTAMSQFHLDERRYPEFLAGPVQVDESGNELPINEISGSVIVGGSERKVALFPTYVDVVNVFSCPFSSMNGDERDYTFGGPGTPPDDTVDDPMHAALNSMNIDHLRSRDQYRLYKYSSYDYQKPAGTNEDQVHYCTAWWPSDSNDPDVERQLRFRTPPKDTVITWCSHHRDADDNGQPFERSTDIVLFLDGHVGKVQTWVIDRYPGTGTWTGGWKAPR